MLQKNRCGARMDATQFDRRSKYFDPKATREAPRWLNVDVRLVTKTRLVPLTELRTYPQLAGMQLLKRGIAEKLMSGPQARENVYAFMQQAAKHGAKFYACSQALSEHRLSLEELVPETSGAAGAAAYVARSLEDGWSLVVY